MKLEKSNRRDRIQNKNKKDERYFEENPKTTCVRIQLQHQHHRDLHGGNLAKND